MPSAAVLTRRRFIATATRAAAGLSALGAAGCAGAAGARVKDKLKIALSNSSIGNKWRLEMENIFKAALRMPSPTSRRSTARLQRGQRHVSKQSQQLSNLIAAKVDAILIDAASPTGLNGMVNQAIDRGILVVSFDNIVTEPRALKVNTDQFAFGRDLASGSSSKISGKGNVIMVTGVAGTSSTPSATGRRNVGVLAEPRHQGGQHVHRHVGLARRPDATRPPCCPSLPQIDGIWGQGGTDGVLKAFLAAKRPLPPTAGEAENGFRKFMIGLRGPEGAGYLDRPAAVPRVGGAGAGAADPAPRVPAQEHHHPVPDRHQRHFQGGLERVPGPAGQLLQPFTDTDARRTCVDVALTERRRRQDPPPPERPPASRMSARRPQRHRVEGAGLRKAFGGVRALDDATFGAARRRGARAGRRERRRQEHDDQVAGRRSARTPGRCCIGGEEVRAPARGRAAARRRRPCSRS